VAGDALEPGDGTYPYFPRKLDGSPAWSDVAETDGVMVPGRGPGGMVTPMPRGFRTIIRNGGRVLVDVTPYNGAEPVNPPTLP
jgi:hypothetical protein